MYRMCLALFCLFISGVLCQHDVMQALGNHGDRLSDLESKMAAVTSLIGNLKTELNRVESENAGLRQRLQTLESNFTCVCTSSGKAQPAKGPLTHAQSKSTTSTPSASRILTSSLGPSTMSLSSISLSTNQITATTRVYLFQNRSNTWNSVSSDKPSTVSLTYQATVPSRTVEDTTKTTIFNDCDDAYSKGVRKSGSIQIHPAGLSSPLHVFCHISTSGGWIVIQRRKYGNVSFDRGWDDYKRGFGDFDGDFWIGNELIHELTYKQQNCILYISLSDWSGRTKHAQYANFLVDSESEGYRLNVGAYSGDAGDSFHYHQSGSLSHNHMKFSTRDKDNDPHFLNCARTLHGGWWFNQCYSSNLNGPYLYQPYGHRNLGESYGDPTLEGTGIEWYPWQQRQYSLKFAEMMLKLGSTRDLPEV